MPDHATGVISDSAATGHIEIENDVLELFAPAHKYYAHHPLPGRSSGASLWRADAIHRARNLAQLTLSLATLAEHPSRCWLPGGLVAEARRLARAYEALGMETSHTAAVPCAPLLIEITTRLVRIFGGVRHIELAVSAEAVTLGADARRALILMCSEVIINALKYAYPGAGGGSICVALTNCNGVIELVVEDDGVGAASHSRDGHGRQLLAELGALCGATVVHGPGRNGAGHRVVALAPAISVKAPLMAVVGQA